MHGKVGKETCRCFDGALLLLHLRLGSRIHGHGLGGPYQNIATAAVCSVFPECDEGYLQ